MNLWLNQAFADGLLGAFFKEESLHLMGLLMLHGKGIECILKAEAYV